eukprot:2572211-Pleurochrysis_carterae.AAC.1
MPPVATAALHRARRAQSAACGPPSMARQIGDCIDPGRVWGSNDSAYLPDGNSPNSFQPGNVDSSR